MQSSCESRMMVHSDLRSRGSKYDMTEQDFYDEAEGNEKSGRKESQATTPTKSSSNSILILLLIMVALTWGIAATAYFGIVDYRAVVDRSSSLSTSEVTSCLCILNPLQYQSFFHPLRTIADFLILIDDTLTGLFKPREKLHYVDKRRPIALISPVTKTSTSWKATPSVETRSTKAEPDVAEPQEYKKVPPEVKQDVSEKKQTKKSERSPKEESPKKQEKKTKTDEKKKEKPKKKSNAFTSEKDKPILNDLKAGDKLLKNGKPKEAEELFRKLIESNPGSPRARFGLAEALNALSQKLRSNTVLQDCIKVYGEVPQVPGCPAALKRQALLTKADRETFLGHLKSALQTLASLARDFPKDAEVLNQLGVAYLMIGRNDKAKTVYEAVLKLHPDNGFALTHLGFVVKNEGDWVRGADLLHRGISTMEEGTQSGKFYFHLGDALHRTNRTKEAEEIYALGAERGLFRSKYQRSLYNVDRLKSRPFWTAKQTGAADYIKKLEQNWKTIRDEALKVMDVKKGLFLEEEEGLKNTGDWRQFTLFQKGQKMPECSRVPKTCALIDQMPNAKGCRRGQIKYSVMMPGTHVWPHTGPTNCRLRMHLGLVIPKTGDGARLRCADEYRTWEEGKVLIFDDSFEHEVWQNAESFRLILIVDVWHPDITEHEKRTLTPI